MAGIRGYRGGCRLAGGLVVVTQVTSLTRSGLADFLIQRVSAVVLALYTLCLLSYFLVNEGLDHRQLAEFFGSASMRAFSVLAVLSTAAHGWVGMWTVGTDYIRPHYFGARSVVFRMAYQIGCGLLLFIYVWWGVRLFWTLPG